MNLTKAQLQAIGHLIKVQPNNEKTYIIWREKITKISQPFVSGVVMFNKDGAEIGIAPINGRVIDALAKKGLIGRIAKDSVNGALYEATESLKGNEKLIAKCSLSFGERPSQQSLKDAAFKYGCDVLFDSVPRLFKVVRLDGVKLSKPFIDVSTGGVKVTRLTDLTLEEWESEIASAIKRSHLIR